MFASFAALLLCTTPTLGLDNGLGRTPPLAYSTWNLYNDEVNETLVKQLSNALHSTGLHDVGFKQINIDAGYLMHERHPATHELQVNHTKFPSGMASLAGALQSQDVGLGVYTDIGNGSCGTGPGSYGHYERDAETFASWNISYLKVDFCGFHPPLTFKEWMDPTIELQHWQGLRDALNKTGHPIYYSICPHGKVPAVGPSVPWYKNGTGRGYTPPLSWTADERKGVANSLLVEYTNLFDFWYADYWEDFRACGPTAHCPTCVWNHKCSKFENGTKNPAVRLDPGGFLTDVDAMVQLTKPEYAGPGSWADADMLQVCNFGQGGAAAGGRGDHGMTLEEYRAEYSIWAVFASPMIISANLVTIADTYPDCLAMLKNKELISISQDPLGAAGKMIRQRTNTTDPENYAASRNYNIVEQVFARQLSGGVLAVVLFNRAEHVQTISVTWDELGLPPNKGSYSVRDIWAHNQFGADVPGSHAAGYAAAVQPHHVQMITVTPV